MDVNQALLFILMLALVGVVGVFAAMASARRRSELAALAHQLGWSFEPDGAGAHEALGLLERLFAGGARREPGYTRFAVFDRGSDRRAYNTLRGAARLRLGEHQRQCQILAGDYRYTTGSGKNKRTHRFSYLLVELPAGYVPETIIRPEGIFDGLAGLLGMDDIDFESVEFSDAFHVTGRDKRFAYDLCNVEVMQLLLDTRPPMLELDGKYLCLTDGRRRWSAQTFTNHLAWVDRFLKCWPRHLAASLQPTPEVSGPAVPTTVPGNPQKSPSRPLSATTAWGDHPWR